MEIDLTAMDKAGNIARIRIEKGGVGDVEVADFKVYPVPFDPEEGEYVSATFTLSQDAYVFIRIYDFAGLPVFTVIDEYLDSGGHTVSWPGTDESGNLVAPGGYIAYVKVDFGERVITKNLKIAVGGVKK